jgi:ABC-type nitrate/sulfonate/bicarbonate transport system permease component
VDPQHLDVARVFGAGRWRLWREVIWPSALPSILNGYRVGFGIAWMAVVAAEMVAAQSGLGYLIEVSQNLVRTDRVLVGMLAIGALGFLFDRVFLWGSKRWLRWSS